MAMGLATRTIIAIYPREGTETVDRAVNVTVQSIAIYPREGTETPNPACMAPSEQIAIYPREGTETGVNCILVYSS